VADVFSLHPRVTDAASRSSSKFFRPPPSLLPSESLSPLSLSGGDGSSGGALGRDSRPGGAERCGRVGFVYAYVALSGPSARDRTSDLRFDIQSSRPGTFDKVHRRAKMALERDRTAENVHVVRELRVVPVIMFLLGVLMDIQGSFQL
jgi:hypothetical protein